ncbi:MAG: nitroreductase family protein, partial [Acetobacteraceae bacterium]
MRAIIEQAQRAPSGGNLQPWFVHALTGEPLRELVAIVRERAKEHPLGEGTEYNIYPPNLKEPYRSRRFKCGEDLYALVGIGRAERERRLRQ